MGGIDMWRCANCDEQVEDHFEVCWNCQFAKDGTPQPVYEEIAEEAKAVLKTHLHPGEFLSHWAYGVRPLSIKMKLLLSLLGIIWAIMLPFSLQAYFPSNTWRGEGNRISTFVLLAVMASLFYTLARQLVEKRCFVGLTNHRFIALLCEDDLRIKKVVEYKLEALTLVKTATETKKATIEIGDPQESFKAIFHQTDLADNLRQAVEITEILGGISNKLTENGQTR
jgi:hypothetical protein